MTSRGSASAKRIAAAERREKAWELRKRGHSYRVIAEKLAGGRIAGATYSKSQAQRDVQKVFDDLVNRTTESAAEERALDLARLDDLLVAWFAPAVGLIEVESAHPDENRPNEKEPGEARETAAGSQALAELNGALRQAIPDKQAADVVIKIIEQRAKLLGLHRQDVALMTPTPLAVVVGTADLSGLGEAELDAVIRNLQAALGAGDD